MSDPLMAAVRRYHAAVAGIDEAKTAAARQIERARRRADEARDALAAAIAQAARDGMRQRDIVKATGYSRERIRQICRAAGVESDE